MNWLDVLAFGVTSLGAVWMTWRGLRDAAIFESIIGISFSVIALSIFFGTRMHLPLLAYTDKLLS
ncbi:MAG: hypothetical protein LPL00_07570 [Alphaproteobacteria bacterium]|nr:hypothetical protein [Alphaproteobacteria bacterium]MDX5369421.1 hypothetical protein [Alphaproteobacteria bacterium]MDX5464105.1 hypothetical protein [Alphaproteobacteria bacterium]